MTWGGFLDWWGHTLKIEKEKSFKKLNIKIIKKQRGKQK